MPFLQPHFWSNPQGTVLQKAYLQEAILIETKFIDADLEGHDLDNLTQRDAILDEEEASTPDKIDQAELPTERGIHFNRLG